jgi:hypothetical protein
MGADDACEAAENAGSAYTKLLILLEFSVVLLFASNCKKS